MLTVAWITFNDFERVRIPPVPPFSFLNELIMLCILKVRFKENQKSYREFVGEYRDMIELMFALDKSPSVIEFMLAIEGHNQSTLHCPPPDKMVTEWDYTK